MFVGLFSLFFLDNFSFPLCDISIVSLSVIPVRVYAPADSDKALGLKENQAKSVIYLWTNNITGDSYVGSAVDLTKRLRQYYSPGFLKKELNNGTSIIYRALLKYGYSNFSLVILEYCDILGVIEREQYYIDSLNPTYNICKLAKSSQGRVTTDLTWIKLEAARLLREYVKQGRPG